MINNLITNGTCGSSAPTVFGTGNNVAGNLNGPNSADNDPNIDDRFSVVSDGVAWSTEQIINSDSDLESYSPSKHTPYSTYSSNSSHNVHPSITEFTSLINHNNNAALNYSNPNNQIASSYSNNQPELLNVIIQMLSSLL